MCVNKPEKIVEEFPWVYDCESNPAIVHLSIWRAKQNLLPRNGPPNKTSTYIEFLAKTEILQVQKHWNYFSARFFPARRRCWVDCCWARVYGIHVADIRRLDTQLVYWHTNGMGLNVSVRGLWMVCDYACMYAGQQCLACVYCPIVCVYICRFDYICIALQVLWLPISLIGRVLLYECFVCVCVCASACMTVYAVHTAQVQSVRHSS